ncbi:Uncharacterized protein PBTT_02636 [Plasmodiophora brassicae]
MERKVAEMESYYSMIDGLLLYAWQVRVEIDAPNVNITGDVLQCKARDFRDQVLKDFGDDLDKKPAKRLQSLSASRGWLSRYTNRKGVRSVR